MSTVTSKDGTTIAYDRTGSGPPVILVDGALCSRAFGPSAEFAKLLAARFTVFTYDRRGRNESGDTQPYAPEREVEDLAAVVDAAGGRASLVGFSSGAALALDAAAAGLAIDRVAAYEPPFIPDGDPRRGIDFEARLRALVAAGDRKGAVRFFMRDMVGVPAPIVFLMSLMPGVAPKLRAIAHTLPYDAAVMRNFALPRARFGTIRTPTLAMNGSRTEPWIKATARDVASIVPGAQHREIPGQTHQVKAAVLTPVLFEFLGN